MQHWSQTLLEVSNENDHQAEQQQPKQFEGLTIQSAGRFHVAFSRKPLAAASFAQTVEEIKEEFGLDEEQLEVGQLQLQESGNASANLLRLFTHAKIAVGGDVAGFVAAHQIGAASDFQSIVNDGNTIILYFADGLYQYILFHQIHY